VARTAPKKEEDILIAASNSWIVSFDNLSSIPQALSDAFCRLSTGGGIGNVSFTRTGMNSSSTRDDRKFSQVSRKWQIAVI
jgi:hypothetical protein